MKQFTRKSPARVLIVDDSALMRQVLTSIINSDPELTVVDTAIDPLAAREKIKRYNPDVVTLDIEMPRMNGIDFLQKIMTLRPTPVVMVSSLTQAGAKAAIEALEIGAVDTIGKPSTGGAGLLSIADEIIAKVKTAASSRLPVRTVPDTPDVAVDQRFEAGALIAIGASTGGIPAVQSILQVLPPTAPPVVVAQHMPEGFTSRFAARLADLCSVEVSEASEGEVLKTGHAYIAPAGFQTRVVQNGAGYRFQVRPAPRVNGFCPSVDVLFSSVAQAGGNRAVGALLTGMGHDGAQGLLDMRDRGARTLIQDEATCVVYGMPRVARALGAAEQELPLPRIPRAILAACLARRPEPAAHVLP